MDFDEDALVRGLKNNDEDAYRQMVISYSNCIYFLLHNILHNEMKKEDIEECAADVFFDAWRKINEFNPSRSSFKTWLFMLSKYKALTYRRSIRSFYSESNIADIEISDTYKLEEHVLAREEQSLLMCIINSFSLTDRNIFVRRYFYNESIREIAITSELTESAVKNRLLRRKKQLKEEGIFNE